MKIVEINTVNGTGSTGKIAVSLYKLAQNNGHDPYIAYGRGNSPSNVNGYKIGTFLDFGTHVLSNFFLGNSGFASQTATKHFLDWLDTIQPDILHLHNLHGFYLNVNLLFEYIKCHNIPVIWTLHDCWSFTGQCAFFDYANCSKWKSACHNCPIYRTDYPYSLFKDNSRQNYKLKKNVFTNVPNLTIVTPSHWLANLVKQSFLQNYETHVIHNGIDLNLFHPTATHNPLCNTKKFLLGVANIWDRRKGLDYFLQLADLLDDSFHIVLIGVNKKQQQMLSKKNSDKITSITRTNNQQELVQWYSNAYAFVNPTLEDNFPTTNLEALACGTPVITFNTGGSPESISEKSGIIVEKGNVKKLKEAILSLECKTEITSSSCREQAMNFNKDIKFTKYLQLYQKIYNT